MNEQGDINADRDDPDLNTSQLLPDEKGQIQGSDNNKEADIDAKCKTCDNNAIGYILSDNLF